MPRPPADAPLLNLELIRRTALRLIDRNGLEGLSMRKLASELSVTPRSLYHYVPTKDALLREVYVSVLDGLELPDPHTTPWQDGLRLLARNFRALCHRHRSVAPYFWEGHEPTRRDTDIIERLFALLIRAGIPEERVVQTGHALVVFIVGYILSELEAKYEPTEFEQRRSLARQTPGAYPTLLTLPPTHTPSHMLSEANFEAALALLIAGIEGSAAS